MECPPSVVSSERIQQKFSRFSQFTLPNSLAGLERACSEVCKESCWRATHTAIAIGSRVSWRAKEGRWRKRLEVLNLWAGIFRRPLPKHKDILTWIWSYPPMSFSHAVGWICPEHLLREGGLLNWAWVGRVGGDGWSLHWKFAATSTLQMSAKASQGYVWLPVNGSIMFEFSL